MRLRTKSNPIYVLQFKDRRDVEYPEYLRCVYHRFRAMVEGFNCLVKSKLWYQDSHVVRHGEYLDSLMPGAVCGLRCLYSGSSTRQTWANAGCGLLRVDRMCWSGDVVSGYSDSGVSGRAHWGPDQLFFIGSLGGSLVGFLWKEVRRTPKNSSSNQKHTIIEFACAYNLSPVAL